MHVPMWGGACSSMHTRVHLCGLEGARLVDEARHVVGREVFVHKDQLFSIRQSNAAHLQIGTTADNWSSLAAQRLRLLVLLLQHLERSS